MNNMKQLIAVSALAWGVALPAASFAQMGMEPGKAQASSMAQPASMTEGEVKKVDPDAGKVTIKHGPIKNMDMPGMTMVFTAKDKSLLTNVKAGDKIRFTVESEGGKMVLTEIQPMR